MKEMLHVMETSCFPYGKRLLSGILLTALLELLVCLFAFHFGGGYWIRELLLLGAFACYIVFAFLNHKRYHRFADCGALARIRLLPQSKRFFVYGELLFSLSFVMVICIMQYVLCFLLMPSAAAAYSFSSESYAYLLFCSPLYAWMPDTFAGALQMLLFLVLAASLEVWLHIRMETVKEGVYRLLLTKLLALFLLPLLFLGIGQLSMFDVLPFYIGGRGDMGSALLFALLYAFLIFLLIKNCMRQFQEKER